MRSNCRTTIWILLTSLQLVYCISSGTDRVGRRAASPEQHVSPNRRLAVIAMLGSAAILGRLPNDLLNDDDERTNMTTDISEEKGPTSLLYDPLVSVIAGSALTTSSTVVRYPLDTATVRLQTTGSEDDLFKDCWKGITTPLLANIPAGAVFFLTKDAIANTLQQQGHMSSFLVTAVAVAVAQVPNWIIKNPSEVIKTQQQAGTDSSSLKDLISLQDYVEFYYQGFGANLRYNYPADMIKFCLYEQLHLAVHPGIAGAIAAVVAQILTTPLDVVRNREMALIGEGDDNAQWSTAADSSSIWAGTSTRIAKAVVSGGVQFAALDKTQEIVAAWLQNNV